MSISVQTVSTRRWALVALVASYGVAAVALPYHLAGVQPSLPNTVAGGTLLVCGLLLIDGGDRRLGGLVTLGGVAWFAPDLAPAVEGPARSALEAMSLLYVGFLSHAAATLGDRRLARPVSRLVTVVGYGVAITAATVLVRPGLAVLGAALMVMGADTARRTTSAHLDTGWLGPVAAWALAAGLLIPTFLRWAPDPLSEPTLSRILIMAVTTLAVLCVAGSYGQVGSRTAITMDANAAMALATEIGNLNGRGPIEAVFPSADDGPWIDLLGLPVDVHDEDLTVVGRPSAPLAGLLTRTPTPRLADDDLTQLLRLAGDHARLNFLIRRRAAAIETSRRRLIDGADDERRRLESALREGAGATLDRAVGAIPPGPGLVALRERAAAVRAGLAAIARGIDPLGGRGLRDSLDELAAHAGVPVSVSVTHEPPTHVTRTIWFACSECVANVAKHAPQARVDISVVGEADPVRVTITDDGPGGADPHGHGLRGLADRAGAVGGRVTVTSTCRGTRVELVVPRGERAR